MRLDKFLKVSRIIKRRSVAKDASDKERVLVNDKVAKPSTSLKVGDIVTVNYFRKTVIFKVLELKEHVNANDASSMYELIEIKEQPKETI